MRVAAGAIARKYLPSAAGAHHGYLSQIGALQLARDPTSAYDNPFFCPDPARVKELEKLIWDLRSAGDSIGARVTVRRGRAAGTRRTGIRPARCRHRARHDGHQCRQGRGDRRRRCARWRSAAANIAMN
jgi:hypothetical protein